MLLSELENTSMVGLVFALRRAELGLSWEEVAEKAGTTWEFIAEVESGRTFPLQEWFERIAVALGNTGDQILAMIEHGGKKLEVAMLLREFAQSEDTGSLKELVTFCQDLARQKGF